MRAHHTGGLLVAHADVVPARLLVGYVGVTLATAVARFQRRTSVVDQAASLPLTRQGTLAVLLPLI